jgi:alpha-tubulin suppressor-like RCC1 family protein
MKEDIAMMTRALKRHVPRWPDGMIILTLAVVVAGALSIAPGTAGAVKVVDIATGHGLSVALTDDGRVWTWGYEWHGVLGRKLSIVDPVTDQSTPKPANVSHSNLRNVTDIAAGEAHVLALKDDGTVLAWGCNNYGQLGDGTTSDSESDAETPSQVSGLNNVKSVAAGLFYSVALKNDGTVWAWGYNRYGQLGDGEISRYESVPVQVVGLSGIVRVYAGYNHNVAIDSSGNVWAWGSNDCGELGDGTNISRCTPIRLAGLAGVKDVALGSSYTVVLDGDGTVRAWGENYGGWLGDGTTTGQLHPVSVKGLDHVSAIATGEGISFASLDDGTVRAWGFNSGGLIGNGIRDQKVYQTGKVGSMNGISYFAVGATHVLGLKADGSLWAWGDNQFGEMGKGKIDDKTYLPSIVSLGDPLADTSLPTSAPDDTGNATDDTPASPADSSRYMLLGVIALVCLVLAAGALVWFSRK